MKTCPRCRHTYPNSTAFCPQDGAGLETLEALTPGTVFRRKFQIIEELGRGGMGVVYRARHILLKEDRALKLINARYSDDPQAVRRFLAEALMANQIDHPNVARVHDADETDDGQPYVVMEYVPGTNLRRLLRPDAALPQTPLEPLRAIGIAVQVCAALEAAHQKQIIHRDIKPDNILIARNPDGGDLVKVVDFGIAKAKKELHGPWTGTAETEFSQTGIFLGTPQYSSPEQARGTKGDLLDHRTDIYSLGIVLYEMLAGRPPFTGDIEDVLRQHKEAAPPLPQTPRPGLKIHEELVGITMKALSKEPAARFASADKMRVALEHAREAIRRPVPVQAPVEEPLEPTVPRKPRKTPPAHEDRPSVPEPRRAPKPRPRASPNRAIVVVFVLTIVLGLGAYRIFVREPSTSLQQTEKLERAKQFHDRGAYDEAIALYKEVQALDPANAEAASGITAAETGKKAEEALTPPAPDLTETIRRAEASTDRGDYDTAIAALEQVLQRDPQNTRARSALQTAKTAKAAEEQVFGKSK